MVRPHSRTQSFSALRKPFLLLRAVTGTFGKDSFYSLIFGARRITNSPGRFSLPMVTSLALIYPSGMIASILISEASYLLRVNGNLAKIRASTYLSPEEKSDHLLSKSQRMPEVQGCFCFSSRGESAPNMTWSRKAHQIWHGLEGHSFEFLGLYGSMIAFFP